MQSSVARQGCRTRVVGSRKSVVVVPFTTTPVSRSLTVQVNAYKRKGKSGMRQMVGVPGSQEMTRRAPETPAVDPENSEFVIFFRAKNYMEGKIPIKEGKWLPLSIMKGGQAANFLVKAMETDWGRKLYSKTLIRNIAQGLYKDRDQVEKSIKQANPLFKNATFDFAFKIRDKNQPDDWYKADTLTFFPAESEINVTPIDSIKAFFSSENLSTLFGGNKSA